MKLRQLGIFAISSLLISSTSAYAASIKVTSGSVKTSISVMGLEPNTKYSIFIGSKPGKPSNLNGYEDRSDIFTDLITDQNGNGQAEKRGILGFPLNDRFIFISKDGKPNPVLPPQGVPEPLTILGAVTAVAFGTQFKRKLTQSKKMMK
ncbi:hypothetical protein AsFPU1_3750 [Aphanothece sacrum FPU1]|uniref:PEP-CTERM sorting domain-containing protein n=1 Tax=Aphanothece sacrum FPU1 TaxID=1920663 RepID=A0A401IM38_APHSA|nr:PEP-CTERM sorting domain-containing protein [Aphanothece sacrum]GBF82322.1 hypothetical protein AsFPU1_3750 [Aphanothece sacrum FPU1]GBF84222.1 hypothetical protein AsFPU3_1269 [Aphanothece sacrum FPU3]